MKAIIAVSDLHIGSTVGLCLPEMQVVDGGTYAANPFQLTLYKNWLNFWGEYVPAFTRRARKRVLVINGDVIDGVHHNTVNILSNSLEVQEAAAIRVIKDIRRICPVKIDELHFVAGTEAHAGQAGECERRIAKETGGAPDGGGEYAPFQRWMEVDGTLFQFAHAIGTTSSAAYESSAPMRELVSSLVEAAQWGRPLPDVLVRSHRHRFIEVPIPTERGRIRLVVTPGWQLRTPFVERVDRMRMPHIGGVVFQVEGEKVCQVREKLYLLPEPEAIRI